MANDKLQLPAGATLVEDDQQNNDTPELPAGSTLVSSSTNKSAEDQKPPKPGLLDKTDTAITDALAPNANNYDSAVRTNAVEVPKTLGREVYSGAKSILGMIPGAYHAFADPATDEEANKYAQYEREHGEAPGTETSGLKRIGLGLGRISGVNDTENAIHTYADPKTRPSYSDVLSVAPEAIGAGAGVVVGGKALETGLPKIIDRAREYGPSAETVKKAAGAPVRALANKVPAPVAMKELGLPGHERTATNLVGNDFVPKATAPTPAAPPPSPLGRIEYGEPTSGRAAGLAGNDYSEGATATAPAREPNPLGRIEYAQPTPSLDKPITPAEVKSSPGTSMSQPAQDLLSKILTEEPSAPKLSEPAQSHLNQILGEPTAKPRTPGEPLEHGFNMKPAEDLGNAAREGAEKKQGTISRERRERFRTSDEIQTQKLFKQARTELGEDASSDDVMKRVDELKGSDINPRVGNNTPEAAKADDDYFAQAKKEKGPNASISEVAGRAQELKDAAKSAPKVEEKRAPAAENNHLLDQRGRHMAEWPASEKETVRQPLGKLEKSKGVPAVTDLVNKYNESKGRGAVEAPKSEAHPRGKDIADAYDAMEHNPSDPKVKASYDSLKKTLDEQWDHAVDSGYKFEASEKDPYKNSKEMREDVDKNKHLSFFKTNSESTPMPEGHPMAEVDPKTGLTYNDKFRAVHDLYGHAAHGNEFGPGGEEAAFKAHAATMPKEALPALASETRGQNNWFNFGKHLRNAAGEIPAKGEEGYTEPKTRPFAKSKAGVLPEEFHSSEAATDHADAIAKLHNEGGGSTYNPTKGDMGGKDAYAVPMHPELSRTVEGESVTPEQIKKYMEDPKVKVALAADPTLSVGTWAHEGKTYLDLSSTIADRDEAVALGTKNNQKAIAYLKTREDIQTGGKGTGTPLEVTPNGSAPGPEGAGSVEALNRQASEKQNGTKRIKVLKNGQEIPLIGPDAVDATAGKGETIVKRYADGHEEVQDQGAGATYRGPRARAPHTELSDLEQEAYHPVVEEQVSNLDNESLKKLGKSYGLDPDQYNFQKREALREGGSKHSVERIKFVKDLMAALPDDEKQNIGRAAEELKRNPGMFSNADKSQASRAAAAKSLFPKLREETPAEEKETVRVSLGKLEAKGPAPKATAETAKMSDKELLKAGFTQEDIDAGLHLPKVGGSAAGAAVAPVKEGPISKQLLKTYGKTDDPLSAGFVLPNGDMVKLQGEHDTMVKAAADKLGLKGKPDRESVINKENAVRTRLTKTRAGDELVFSIPEHVTAEQMKQMRAAVGKMGRYGNVAIEQGKPGGESFRKEFAMPSHIDEGIKHLGAEPKPEPSLIPEEAGKHLLPEERASLKTPVSEQTFVDKMKKLPKLQEWVDAANAAAGERKWYQRGTQAVEAMAKEAPEYFKEPGDTDKFLDVVAALSPRQEVTENMTEALRVWKEYVDQGRPEGKQLQKMLKENIGINRGSKIPNALKALAGEDLWPDLTKNRNFKVPSFSANLKGMLDKVTSDGWMAAFADMKPGELSNPSSYHPVAVMTRAAAEHLGWEPAEAQAAIWAFVKTLTEKGETHPEAIREYSKDLADILSTDEEIRGMLKDMGVDHDKLDQRIKGIEQKPEVSSRTTPTTEDSTRKLTKRLEKQGREVPEPRNQRGLNFGDFDAKVNAATADKTLPDDDQDYFYGLSSKTKPEEYSVWKQIKSKYGKEKAERLHDSVIDRTITRHVAPVEYSEKELQQFGEQFIKEGKDFLKSNGKSTIVEPKPETYYHGTAKSKLDSVLKDGIQAKYNGAVHDVSNRSYAYRDEGKPYPGTVFITHSKDDAGRYGFSAGNMYEDNPGVVVETSVPYDLYKKFDSDPVGDGMYHGDIPPEHIVAYHTQNKDGSWARHVIPGKESVKESERPFISHRQSPDTSFNPEEFEMDELGKKDSPLGRAKKRK